MCHIAVAENKSTRIDWTPLHFAASYRRYYEKSDHGAQGEEKEVLEEMEEEVEEETDLEWRPELPLTLQLPPFPPPHSEPDHRASPATNKRAVQYLIEKCKVNVSLLCVIYNYNYHNASSIIRDRVSHTCHTRMFKFNVKEFRINDGI